MHDAEKIKILQICVYRIIFVNIILLWCTKLVYKKSCSQLVIFISFSIEKIIVPCSYCAPSIQPNLLHAH